MTNLSVNVNKVALLRNSRNTGVPDLIEFVNMAISSGADGITVHPRPDQRHATPDDVVDILNFLKKNNHNVEFNIEGNPYHNLLSIVNQSPPTQCTFVPDSINTLTSNEGWNLNKEGSRLSPIVQELKQRDIRVSLFMDPNPNNIALAAELGADRVELYTEPYAKAFSQGNPDTILDKYVQCGNVAKQVGLGLNAGHDLSKENLPLFLEKVENVEEVSIGHAIIVDSLKEGFAETVRKYKTIISKAVNR